MGSEAIRGVTRGAVSFFSGTVLSRVSGLIRDVSMAFAFGSHPALAAFMVSFRLANLFRRLLGDGPLPSGFVPYFESIRKESPKKGALFFRDVFFSLFFLLLAVVGLSEIGLLSLRMSGPSQEIVRLTALMMPGILFICLYGVSSALLQCEKKFFLPSAAPVLFNVVWIATIYLFKESIPTQAVFALSVAVVLGFFLQWASLLPLMYRYLKGSLSLKEIFSFSFFPKEVRCVVKPFAFGLIGVAAVQINTALDALFARAASLEGPAYLWYAIRIEQVPIALLGIALASALLPALSRALANKDEGEFKGLLRHSFDRAFAFMFPCTVALFVLGGVGVNLLYGHGSFGIEATKHTVYCLWGYGVGLLPAVFILLLAPVFYAKKDFKTPMKASLISVAVNIGMNSLFVFGLGLGSFSIALATSISAFCNFIFLFRKVCGVWNPAFIKTIGVSLLAGAITVIFAHFVLGGQGFGFFYTRAVGEQMMQFLSLSGVFTAQVFAYAKLVKAENILSVIRR
jgi:putative peptidoglycan lipid II flippase